MNSLGILGRSAALLLAVVALVAPQDARPQHGGHGGGSSPAPRGQSTEEKPRESYEPPAPHRTIEIRATPEGFAPNRVTVKSGDRVRLVVTRSADPAAPQDFNLDEFVIWRQFGGNKTLSETFVTGRPGDYQFYTRDGRHSGVLTVEKAGASR